MAQGIMVTIVIDRDIWTALQRRCGDLELSPSDYFEHLFRCELARLDDSKQPSNHEQALRRVELAAVYGHLVRTYGELAVSKAHYRYLVEKRIRADGENTFDDFVNAQAPQNKALDAEQLLALAIAYDGLIEQFGATNVDRCHQFSQVVRRQ